MTLTMNNEIRHNETIDAQPGELLEVDVPNADQAIAAMLKRRPKPSERIQFDALWRYGSDKAALAGATFQAVAFLNVPHPLPPGLEGFARGLVQDNWDVCANPKNSPDSDVDPLMLAHLHSRPWRAVRVVSHDARCFAKPLAELAAHGTEVEVIGMTECAGCLPRTEGITFTDIEDIPGLIKEPPLRVRFHNFHLRTQPRWYHPHHRQH